MAETGEVELYSSADAFNFLVPPIGLEPILEGF